MQASFGTAESSWPQDALSVSTSGGSIWSVLVTILTGLRTWITLDPPDVDPQSPGKAARDVFLPGKKYAADFKPARLRV